jgi:radical SAM protein with 4Fe4S-binding SPASM domain
MTLGRFEQLLRDARDAVREDVLEERQRLLERRRMEALADPGLLYPPEANVPRFVVWELTLRCNMRCAHCGSNAGNKRSRELEPAEALKLCDELGVLGCERLTLLGGEPLLREDWQAITERLQRAGVRVNIISNGWLTADRDVVQRIKDAGLTTFALSIDGYGARHDALRRRPGSFARILKSYDHAAALGGLRSAAVTTVTRLSIDDLERIYDLLVDKGVRLWQLQLCTPQGRMQHGDPRLPSPQDLLTLANFIVDKKREKKLRIDPADNVGYYGRWELEEDFRSDQWGRPTFWHGCRAGCQVMGIDANGDVKGCLSLPSVPEFIEGNVRERPLAELWNKPGGYVYNRNFSMSDLRGACKSCEYRGLCRAGCVSQAYCTVGHRGENPMCLYRLSAPK